MIDTFEKLLHIIEKINKLDSPIIPSNKLEEERECIALFKNNRQKLEQLLSSLEQVDLNDHNKINQDLFYLYYEVLDIYAITESLFYFAKAIINKYGLTEDLLEEGQ